MGFVNGIAQQAIGFTQSVGLGAAFGASFGISAIVWIAAWLGLSLVRAEPAAAAGRRDLRAVALALCVFLVPASAASWVGLTLFSAYVAWVSEPCTAQRRGAIIFAALTVPMAWSKALFALCSGWILQADAILVASLIGTTHVGNTIALADGSGQLWIAAGCSSLANLSLTVLLWVVFTQFLSRPTNGKDVLLCLAACAMAIAINVSRISVMGLFPDSYEFLHGSVGTIGLGWLTTIVVFCIYVMGLRRDIPALH